MPKKMTQEEFIEKAKKKHGDKYDYSLVNYVNSTTKVKIKCKKHGLFEQAPDKHLEGNKCRQCAYEERNNPNKLTTEQFIEKAKKKHGDKYDYSLVNYVNSTTKVKIICPEHGMFEQIAQNHLAGCECPKCHNNKSINKKRKVRVRDTKSFIERSKEIHGDKYDYSLVNYINSITKVKIKCKKHGLFEQAPKHHLEKCGCKQCADEEQSKTTEQFIKEAKEIHGDKYDYSLVKYKNTSTKVKIKCLKCGNIFEQKPQDHLKGKGCSNSKCRKTRPLSMTTEEFVEEAKKIHDNKYDYSLVDYKGVNSKVKIICEKHGLFEQKAYNHLTGCGCPICAIEETKLTTEEFIDKAKQTHGDKYDYSLVDYKNIYTKIKIKCKKHGLFEQIPDSHIRGKGCPLCKKYKGEERIKLWLERKNIKFEKPKKYPDLKDKDLLSYDFYLPTYNLLIEFNGIQHYEKVRWNKEMTDEEMREKLKIQRHHDWLKRKYAREHNIELLVIPYWDFDNIEKILERVILEKEIKEVA